MARTEFMPYGKRDLKVPCDRIVLELTEKYFPEIGPNHVDVWMEAHENPVRIGAQVRKGLGFVLDGGYSITGVISLRAIVDGVSDTLLMAILGHEFGHIVNGDVDGIRAKIFDALDQRPFTRDRALRWKEHGADNQAIKRGLGEVLLQASEYLDSIGMQHPAHYYTTQQIRALVRRST